MQLPLPIADLEIPQDSVLPPSAGHRIYCNRSLRLDQVEMVGFDMDYTLAIYVQSEMDRLSIEATARKLVERGHSEELLTMPYRTDFPVRGLLIDRKLGNVLKMDRYKYVKKAFHGMRELTREERRQLYQPRRLRGGTKRFPGSTRCMAFAKCPCMRRRSMRLKRGGRRSITMHSSATYANASTSRIATAVFSTR